MKRLLSILSALCLGIGGLYAQNVEDILAQMTLRQKVGQMFFVRMEALDVDAQGTAMDRTTSSPVTKLSDGMRAFHEKYPCGGVTLFAGNCVDSTQLRQLTRDIHSLALRPLVCIDEEGGKVQRIGGRKAIGAQSVAGMSITVAHRGEKGVRNAIRCICGNLRRLGIDVDFAPVADVNSNPNNPVIGLRAFSSDPDIAASMVAVAVREFAASSVICCLKHFPGHGDTSTDSHVGYAVTSKTWEQMLQCEILPFRAGIKAGAPMVMTAHITAPAVDPSNVPSTLSGEILNRKLRRELGFEGVIITDGMDMGAITKVYSAGDAAVKAILSGVDIILFPLHYTQAFDAVMNAVANGTISEDRIDESVRRILRLKIK